MEGSGSGPPYHPEPPGACVFLPHSPAWSLSCQPTLDMARQGGLCQQEPCDSFEAGAEWLTLKVRVAGAGLMPRTSLHLSAPSLSSALAGMRGFQVSPTLVVCVSLSHPGPW